MLQRVTPWIALLLVVYADCYHFWIVLGGLSPFVIGTCAEHVAIKRGGNYLEKYLRVSFIGWMIFLLIALIFLVPNHYPALRFVVTLGMSLNLLALLANGGYMPVDLREGEHLLSSDYSHIPLNKDTRLSLLCDRFHHPLLYVKSFSIGDIATAIGVMATAVQIAILLVS